MYLDIRNLRLKEHFTQQRLANKAHISRSYLSKLECNIPATVKGVRLVTIIDISKALNVDISKVVKQDK